MRPRALVSLTVSVIHWRSDWRVVHVRGVIHNDGCTALHWSVRCRSSESSRDVKQQCLRAQNFAGEIRGEILHSTKSSALCVYKCIYEPHDDDSLSIPTYSQHDAFNQKSNSFSLCDALAHAVIFADPQKYNQPRGVYIIHESSYFGADLIAIDCTQRLDNCDSERPRARLTRLGKSVGASQTIDTDPPDLTWRLADLGHSLRLSSSTDALPPHLRAHTSLALSAALIGCRERPLSIRFWRCRLHDL
jgi:hypothetical protein